MEFHKVINSRDIIADSLYINDIGFKDIICIRYDNETDRLIYIFSNHLNQFIKVISNLKINNDSIESVFNKAYFFEDKISKKWSLKFNHIVKNKIKDPFILKHNKLSVELDVKEGEVEAGSLSIQFDFNNNEFISLDQLTQEFENCAYHRFSFQILALSAFERASGIAPSRSASISRMILLEMDKIYFYISKLCHTLKHYGLSTELLSSSLTKLRSFISENIKSKNIFKLDDELFSKDFYENYLGLKVFLEKNIVSSRKLLLRGLFNRMELKSHFLGSVVDKSSLKGSAIRCSGVNYNFKLDTDFLFYSSLDLSRNIKNENNLYELYDIMFQELFESLKITENVLLNSPHLGFCFDNFSDYDLNNINDEACFEIETAHGIASIVLYKNSNNRLSYQLSSESLNRLYFFEANLKNYEFSAQNRILDNLAIEFSEIY